MLDPITAIIVDNERNARDGLESLINRFLPKIKIIANKDGYNLKQKIKNLETFFHQNRVKLNTQYGFVMVSTDDVIYCKTEEGNCIVYLTSGKTEIVSFDTDLLKQKLDENLFIDINKTTIINLNYLVNFDKNTNKVILSDIIQKYELETNSAGAKKLSSL